MNFILSEKYKTLAILLLLTAGTLLVHGYHPYAEDAEIYLPGVEKILHPGLFPAGRDRAPGASVVGTPGEFDGLSGS